MSPRRTLILLFPKRLEKYSELHRKFWLNLQYKLKFNTYENSRDYSIIRTYEKPSSTLVNYYVDANNNSTLRRKNIFNNTATFHKDFFIKKDDKVKEYELNRKTSARIDKVYLPRGFRKYEFIKNPKLKTFYKTNNNISNIFKQKIVPMSQTIQNIGPRNKNLKIPYIKVKDKFPLSSNRSKSNLNIGQSNTTWREKEVNYLKLEVKKDLKNPINQTSKNHKTKFFFPTLINRTKKHRKRNIRVGVNVCNRNNLQCSKMRNSKDKYCITSPSTNKFKCITPRNLNFNNFFDKKDAIDNDFKKYYNNTIEIKKEGKKNPKKKTFTNKVSNCKKKTSSRLSGISGRKAINSPKNKDYNLASYLDNISENDKKNILINKIKTDYYTINKPQEINMKYKIAEDVNIEGSEVEPVEKIKIGIIDGYKDIIEKDKNNISNLNINGIEEEMISDSNNIEKDIIKMMSYKNGIGTENESKKKIKNMNKQIKNSLIKKNIDPEVKRKILSKKFLNVKNMKNMKNNKRPDDEKKDINRNKMFESENEFSGISIVNEDKLFDESSFVNDKNINNNNSKEQNICKIF